jgi:Zn-finger nucleic acid-binding protein
MTFCPRDKSQLKDKALLNADVFVCPKCDGIWLPFQSAKSLYKSRKILLPSKYYHDDDQYEIKYSRWESDINCPNDSSLLITYNFKRIEIDICSKCSGLWLDKGEFEKLNVQGDYLTGSLIGLLGRALIEIGYFV